MDRQTPQHVGTLPLGQVKNLGPKSAQWLSAIGIHTLADLEDAGAVQCYQRLRAKGLPASLNLVYAIEAALRGLHWQALPAGVKDGLRQQVAEARKRAAGKP